MPSGIDRYIERVHSQAVLRIRIRSDPYHFAGSGSVSGNVDENDIKMIRIRNTASKESEKTVKWF